MSLSDVDKINDNRSTPRPNAPDVATMQALASHYPLLAEFSAAGGAVQTDQTARTIQDAIDAMSERGGGTLNVATGLYILTDNITIPSNIGLEGQSFGSVIFLFLGPYGIRITGTQPYTTGTISVTRGSATVTGSGTAWSSNLSTNHKIKIDGVPYQIAQVVSDTEITLTTRQYGQTQSGLTYTAAIFVEKVDVSNMILISTSSLGLRAEYTDLLSINKLIVPGPGATGVTTIDCARVDLDTVVVDGSANNGIEMTRTNFSSLIRCLATNNASSGIVLTDCTEFTITSSPANSNAASGYIISGGTRIAVNTSEANENTAYGLVVSGTNLGLIVNGGSYSRNVDGIRLTNTASKATITAGVLATGNSAYGVNIAAAGVDRTTILGNQLTGNSSGAVNNLGSNTINVNNQT